MTAHVLISGQLFRAPEQRTSKAGKPYVTATTLISKPIPNNSLGLTNSTSAMAHPWWSGTTVTNGQNVDNYFDQSGCAFAYYPGSCVPSVGWVSSGNIDMNTGLGIIPA